MFDPTVQSGIANECGSSVRRLRAGKRERIYQGTIDVASISIWLRDPSHDPRDTSLVDGRDPLWREVRDDMYCQSGGN